MKALVVFSGGQDSTTCLYLAIQQYKRANVAALTINYGQRHQAELTAASRIATFARVTHEIVEIGPNILKGSSPLVSKEKLEEYTDYNSLPGGLEKTFVPMRNQLFLTIAANRAINADCNEIWTGVSQEDYGGYPDCRTKFIDSFERTVIAGSPTTPGMVTKENGETEEGEIPLDFKVVTPLMYKSKMLTVQAAMELPLCYEALSLSHTSYGGEYPPTGKDHASLLRAKGFEKANIPDPLVLRAYLEDKMKLPDTKNYRSDRLIIYLPRIEAVLGRNVDD